MEMIQVAKKMEKEAIKSSGIDFIILGFALFFMVAVLTYSFRLNEKFGGLIY